MVDYDDLLQEYGYFDLCDYAVTTGDCNLLKWARQNECTWNENTSAGAAENGHLNVLQWARQNGCPWDKWTCREAASNGHLHILQWALQNGCPWDETACVEAASSGHFDVVQWAMKNCFISDDTEKELQSMNMYTPKHYQSLKWLYEHYGFFSKSLLKQWLDCIHEALDDVIIVPDLVELIKSKI